MRVYEGLLVRYAFTNVYDFSLDVTADIKRDPTMGITEGSLAARFLISEHAVTILNQCAPGASGTQQFKVCSYFNGDSGCFFEEAQCRVGNHRCSNCGSSEHGAWTCTGRGGGRGGRGDGGGRGRGRGGRGG